MTLDVQRLAGVDRAPAHMLAVCVPLDGLSRVGTGLGTNKARSNHSVPAGAIRRRGRRGRAGSAQSNKQDGRFHTGTDTRGMRLVP